MLVILLSLLVKQISCAIDNIHYCNDQSQIILLKKMGDTDARYPQNCKLLPNKATSMMYHVAQCQVRKQYQDHYDDSFNQSNAAVVHAYPPFYADTSS